MQLKTGSISVAANTVLSHVIKSFMVRR